jgi:cell division protein FtsQ
VTTRPPAADASPGQPAGGADTQPGTPDGHGSSGPAAPADVPAVRRHNRWKTAFFLLAVFGVIAAAAWALLGSRFLVVRSIEVTGTHVVPKSEVLAAAAIPPGLPLVRVNTSAVAHRIERIAQIQSAAVTRNWPDRIVITIHERQPALAVPAGHRFGLIDPAGVVVREVPRRPANLPLYAPTGPVLGSPDVRAAADVMRSLPAPIARLVTSVTVPDPDAVTLHLSTRITVDWGSPGQAAQKAHELAILLPTHARYYDVSSPATAATSG